LDVREARRIVPQTWLRIHGSAHLREGPAFDDGDLRLQDFTARKFADQRVRGDLLRHFVDSSLYRPGLAQQPTEKDEGVAFVQNALGYESPRHGPQRAARLDRKLS